MSSDRSAGSVPAGGLVASALAVAAVVGLAVGAVWGLSGSGSTSGSGSQSTATAPVSSGTTSPTASTATDSPSTSVAPTDTSLPTPTGAAPSAPATTTTSADGWRLGSWRITSAGTLGVDTTARNTTTGTRSANLVLYVYVNGQLIATTTARVTDVPAGGTVPVHFAGTDPWKPGPKVLLLQTA